jgi:hypothetical protein
MAPEAAAVDVWIVIFRDDLKGHAQFARELASAHGGEVRHIYEHVFKGAALRIPHQAVPAIVSNPKVAYIEPETYAQRDGVQWNAPWHLDRIDQRSQTLDGSYTYLWDGSGVNIYIVDTGIRMGDSRFGGRVVDAWSIDGGSAVDCLNHGTQVAAVAGSEPFGVAKGATLHAVRIERTCDWFTGVPNSDIIAGLDWVAGNHVKPAVVNLSYSKEPPGWWESLWHRTIEQAVLGLYNHGILVVTTAGNEGQDACTLVPNRMVEVVTVGAVNRDDRRGIWQTDTGQKSSGWGACLTIWAPGSSVPTLANDGTVILSSGTSLSAPAVAGVAALLLQETPGRSPAQIKSRLISTSMATYTSIEDAREGSPHRIVNSINLAPSIHGPTGITEPGTYSWEVRPNGGGSNPLTYLWEYRVIYPGSAWASVGTSNTYQRYVTPGVDTDFELRATVSYGTVGRSWVTPVAVEVDWGDQCVHWPDGTVVCPESLPGGEETM